MAAGDLNPSRRALLGAALAAPVVGLAPFGASQAPVAASVVSARRAARWERALARFRAAEAGLAGVAHSEDEAVYDRAGELFDRALRGLLRTPAPDAEALAGKLALAVRHLAWELNAGDACMAALVRDARLVACCGGGAATA
jgi:hypothetical protein